MSENLRERLLNYEVPPPENTWENISAHIKREADVMPFSKKLYNYEVAPPPDVWRQVQLLLSGNKTPVEVPAKGRLRNIYKMLAAAAILGIIVTASLYVSRKNTTKGSLSLLETNKPENREDTPAPPATESAPFSNTLKPPHIVSSVANGAPKNRRNNKVPNKILENTEVKNPLAINNEPEIIIAAKPIRNDKGEIIQDHDILNNPGNQYISITGPNGQQTKISSKFLHMLLFINDDSDIDEVDGYFDKTFLESLIWKSRFQDWRNKIMTTSLVPSSTNFMDILEFKDLILTDK